MTPTVDRVVGVLERSQRLGFLGPGPINVHLDHTRHLGAVLRSAIPEARTDGRLLDLGAGGGVPGLILAADWPEQQWTLLDANERRTEFLREVVAELELQERVDVVRGRAETVARDPAHRERYAAVVARSFGSPAVTAECGAPFLVLGGRLLVSEPPDSRDSRWPSEPLALLGLVLQQRHDRPVAVADLRKVAPCPDSVPRREGRPAKRPLF